ncbi:inactive ubiquitin thioesterase OTULINL isoform X1 [Struthio camelus]|nr:PREDICTED: inactive ubiquitin thioesterase FAM105A isoform X1 [Struthio camelus australis]XP_009683069.1 PREDICTED: inactive ubiquitin thioesterase FAM105A isoform X1 [Struthio camelus australis]
MQRRHDRNASKNREQFTKREKSSRINHAKRSVGRHEVQSWTTATKRSLWQKVKAQLGMSFLVVVFWCCRRLYNCLAQLLKWWSSYLQRKFIKNLSVSPEVDLLGYCAREWKGDTKQAQHMREAYEDLFWRYHIKYLRQVRRDNYCVLRAVLFQIFSQGIPFPSWMKERDILKLPEKLLYSQGCNWIQQYSFGPERYTGPNAFGKLRKCMEALKTNWTEISSVKDHEERGNMCNTLFSDESKEHKLYEAIKFIMLYEVVEAYEQMKNREERVPNLFSRLLARDSSSDPLSFMMNHLNAVGDSGRLEQTEMFLLGYLLEVRIRVYRLHKFNPEEFQVNYPDEYQREWHEISLLTEDDRYYHIPVTRT